jgi:hypothetical protein
MSCQSSRNRVYWVVGVYNLENWVLIELQLSELNSITTSTCDLHPCVLDFLLNPTVWCWWPNLILVCQYPGGGCKMSWLKKWSYIYLLNPMSRSEHQSDHSSNPHTLLHFALLNPVRDLMSKHCWQLLALVCSLILCVWWPLQSIYGYQWI